MSKYTTSSVYVFIFVFLCSKIQNVEQRESQIYKIVSQRDQEIEDRCQQIDDMQKVLQKKE